jgi:hypothetical protein
MSAFGFLVAAPTVDDVRGYPASLTSVDWNKVASLYADMETRARRLLRATAPGDLLITRTADRPSGTSGTACGACRKTTPTPTCTRKAGTRTR